MHFASKCAQNVVTRIMQLFLTRLWLITYNLCKCFSLRQHWLLDIWVQREISGFGACVNVPWLFFQAKELQTLHNLRKLFIQDLTARVKKVKSPTFTCGLHLYGFPQQNDLQKIFDPLFLLGWLECRAGLWGRTLQCCPEAEDLLPREQPGAAHQSPQTGKRQ